MDELLLRMMGPLLRAIYLIPFASFFIINKRKKEFVYDTAYDSILVGIIFGILHVSSSFIVEGLIFTGSLPINNPNDLSTYQLIPNVFLFISSGLLLMALYKESKKIISKSDIINITIYILLISSVTAFTNENLLFRLNIILYFVAIYFLINTLVLTGLFLERYQRDYYFAIIGAVILTIDPLIYLTMYNTVFNTFPSLDMFYYYRYARYLVGSIAISLLLIPHLRFALKLKKKKIVGYSKEDTLVENTIKRLFNETQKIYGRATGKIFKKSCNLYKKEFNKKIECHKPFEFKNLSYREQKEYLKLILNVYEELLSDKLTTALLKSIKDNKNDGLIAECAPKKDIKNLIIN